MLQSKLLGEKDQWSNAVMTWRRLQRELEGRKSALGTRRRREALGVKTRQEEDGSPSEVAERRRITGGPNEGKVQRVEEPSEPGLMLVKKRKQDEEERAIPAQDYSDDVREGDKRKTPGGRNRTSLDLVVSRCEANGVIATEEELITPLHSVRNIKSVGAVAEGGAAGKNL